LTLPNFRPASHVCHDAHGWLLPVDTKRNLVAKVDPYAAEKKLTYSQRIYVKRVFPNYLSKDPCDF
jgi:hypothetical protein